MKIPVELQTEIVGDNVVLFIGAGFVKSYLGGMPSWAELLHKAFEHLTGKPDGIFDYCSPVFDGKGRRILPPGEYLRVAQQFELARETINLERAAKGLVAIESIHHLVQDEINSKYRKDDATKAVKGMQLLNLKERPFGVWVTTNYDTFIEDLFFDGGFGKDLIIDRPVRNIDFRPAPGGRLLLKIHGSIKTVDPEASIVITEDDYHRFLRQDKYLTNKLYTLFCERTVVFLGYSLSDPNIQFIYNEVLFDQKRGSGDRGRSFSQVRPAYFISRDKIDQATNTYYSHKRINYIAEYQLEDFFADVERVFKKFERSRLDIQKRIETNKELYEELFGELVRRSETDLKSIPPEKRERVLSFIYDLLELYKISRSPLIAPFQPFGDHNDVVRAIHKGTSVCEVWIEEDLANGKLDLYQANVRFINERLGGLSDWFVRHRLEQLAEWLLQFEGLQDRDRLAEEYCRMLFAFDDAFDTWDDYKFCLERYVVATNLYPMLDPQTMERVAERLHGQLSRCGRGYGDSWYSTEKVYECWRKFNPQAWPYLKKEILKHGTKIDGKVYLSLKDQAMLDYLEPGRDFKQFLPKI